MTRSTAQGAKFPCPSHVVATATVTLQSRSRLRWRAGTTIRRHDDNDVVIWPSVVRA